MLKIRLKRLGMKKTPTYRIIVINSTTKREGRPIEELGHYNPKTKVMQFDKAKAEEWISKGAQPTETVAYLLKNCNPDGTLNYKKKDGVKLSKKAQQQKLRLRLKLKQKQKRQLRLQLKKLLKQQKHLLKLRQQKHLLKRSFKYKILKKVYFLRYTFFL